MLYQTWTFALFFAVVYGVFLLVQGTRLKVPWLLVASYFFYACSSPLFLLLLVWATVVDYLAVVGMSRTRWRRSWLAVSLLDGVFLLGFFKYAGFFVESVNALLGRLGLPVAVVNPAELMRQYAVPAARHLGDWLAWLGVPQAVSADELLMSAGLSFFIFQSLTYTIGFYRGQVAREPSFLNYAAFVAFFPKLLMGPIERASDFLPQLRQSPKITRQDVADGASLFVVGLFKKLALADYFALYVAKVFDSPGQHHAPALLLASVAYAWQIYFDFSGYTDMARGVARLLGFRLMLNFNHPYLATGLGDFWRRWHISLSTWFRDYVYIPLGGNRRGEVRTYVNMALTMVISGLWHGAAWTFVIWGALHAVYRVLTRRLESSRFYAERVPTFAKRLWVFALVTLAWIFFRAESVSDAWTIVARIFTSGWADPRCPVLVLVLIACVWCYQAICESRLRWVVALAPVRIAMVVFMVLYLLIMPASGTQGFIYLQF